MIQVVEHPSFIPADFDPARKKPGLSAIVRLSNQEDFAEQALRSILPFFDEIVIVYNQCTDRTPEIVEKFAVEEPQRVKAFHYVPEVFPQGSEMCRVIPADHVASRIHYNNFAVSRATRRLCTIWDGDMLAAPVPLGRAVDRLRKAADSPLRRPLSPWGMGLWWYSGVNLSDKDGKIFVIKARARVWGKKDHGFWRLTPGKTFRPFSRGAVLNSRWLVKKFVGFVYFHLKGMKRDRGIGKYQLEKNPNSPYKKVAEEIWSNPEVITFEEYCRIEPAARSLPSPESLGIRPLRRD